ncbi:hypothetical protein C0Q70_18406 [Pomacea canaliculata]|uniref:Ig-like domain-containing protein n=1 Tax=Pomacea canaliculata TaxID=400727 RepID=A0A2T7NN42_POMCA|nr:hypothetical protein C0Q70_18406 [Pomacea canaliculata]
MQGTRVARCFWQKDRPVCNTVSGYQHTFTDEVGITIPQSSRNQSGRYACIVQGSESTAFASCNFTVMTAGTTTCAIPSVKMSSQTSLTCNFPEDISKTRADISVYHHSMQGRTETVMSCTWEKEKLNCSTHCGYEVEGNVSDHVILRVHNTSEDHEGTYDCQIKGFVSAFYKNCSFELEKEVEQQPRTTSFCNISRVNETESVELTCAFSVDVNATRQNFSVIHLANEGRKAVDILTCVWVKEKVNCVTAPEYEFNSTITDQLVIRVPRASRDHNGTYACHVQSFDSTGFAPCEFIFSKDGKTKCEIPSVKLMSQTSLTCYFPEDISKTRSDFTVHHHSIQGFTDAVSSCEWNNEKLNCSTSRGYEVDGNVTDHVTLRVHNTSKNHEGLYSCQMTGVGSDGYENCSFQLEKDDKQQLVDMSSCNISSVKETKAAELICTFSVDVNETKQNFKVIHLGHYGRKSFGVLVCIWMGDRLDCTTSPTYEFNNTVSRQLVVRIPRASRDHSGNYACYVPVSQLDGFESCEFMVMTDILDCGWSSGKMDCSIYRPGYKYDSTTHVSNKFSLEILRASAEHIGTYRCNVADVDSKNIKPCEFRVKVVEKTVCVISSKKTRTSLTCYYPEDLNKTRTNFTIYHYPRTGLKEVIVACEWKRNNLTCNTTHGYEFDNRVSDYLTLKIPMALESQEGAYSCHISGARSLHYDLCTVTPEKTMTSTCQIPSVEEAEPTTLTCRFIVDVNMTKRNFAVVHYSNTDRKAAEIANCTWLGAHLDCTTADGYHFNNTAMDHVVIRVPQASHNHSGTYVCHIMGVVDSSFEPCEFIIMPATTSSCNISSVQTMEAMTLTCTFNVDINMTRRNFAVVHRGVEDGKGADVLNCTWMNEQLNCTTAPGYKFNKIVTNHFSMKIPQISKENRGIYACHVLGARSNGSETCKFISSSEGYTDKFFLNWFIIAAGAIAMCLLLSLIPVIVILRKKNTSRINERSHEEEGAVNERTPMLQDGDGGRDQETCGSPVDEYTNQNASQEQDVLSSQSLMQSVDGVMNHQTSPQSGSLDEDTQSNRDITGNNNTQDGRHSPVQTDAHEEEGNQTSLQSGSLGTQPPANEDCTTSLNKGAREKIMLVTSQKKKKGRRKENATTDESSLPFSDTDAALVASKR